MQDRGQTEVEVADFLGFLPPPHQKIARLLLQGHTKPEVARLCGIKPRWLACRIAQLRDIAREQGYGGGRGVLRRWNHDSKHTMCHGDWLLRQARGL